MRRVSIIVLAVAAAAIPAPADANRTFKYGDETPDGQKSLGGSGEMIRFNLNNPDLAVTGIRIHGARYGTPEPPNEKFLIYLLNEDLSIILHAEMVDYSLFERGDAAWVDMDFQEPRDVPETFWIAVDFRAHRTKGVYVSYDTSTDGTRSKVGLPGIPPKDVDFEGDWMIQVKTTAE